MSLIHYDPMKLISRMQNEINTFFKDSNHSPLPSLFNEEEAWFSRE